jgi:hypothetical protein
MLLPNRFSAIWIFGKKFDPESEHGKNGLIKRDQNDWNMIGEIPVLQHSQSHSPQQQSVYRKLWRAGILLSSLVVLHYVYFGAFWPCKFNNFNSKDQTPILHFSTPTGTYSPPTGLFIDGNQTWHMYFPC